MSCEERIAPSVESCLMELQWILSTAHAPRPPAIAKEQCKAANWHTLLQALTLSGRMRTQARWYYVAHFSFQLHRTTHGSRKCRKCKLTRRALSSAHFYGKDLKQGGRTVV